MHAVTMTPEEIGRLGAVLKPDGREEGTLALRRAIYGELTACQRECLIEYCLKGKTLEQIANERGVCISTVWRHIRAARKKLGTLVQYHYNYRIFG